MATDRSSYALTNHLRERYVQRTNKKYMHLDFCRSAQCYNCDAIRLAIMTDLRANREAIDAEIKFRLSEAEENRSYFNNTGFMEWYFEKYGYEKRFEFLVHDLILFVVIHDEGQKVVVTCVSAKTHLAGRSHLAKARFNQVKTKEEKRLESTKT